MTTIGFIGAGLIGATVARLSVAAGHDVVLSNSRGPETLLPLAAALGDRAVPGTPEQASEAGDLVVVTIPLGRYRDVPVAPLHGKTVIDTMNYFPDRDGHIQELDDGTTTTSELLQWHLPDSHVVKGFNNIYYTYLSHLNRPADDPQRSALAIAGDNTQAKRQVAEFLDSIGYDTVDAGLLSEGWLIQRGGPVDSAIYYREGSGPSWPGDPHNAGPGYPVTAAQLRAKLDEAHR